MRSIADSELDVVLNSISRLFQKKGNIYTDTANNITVCLCYLPSKLWQTIIQSLQSELVKMII